MTVTPVESRWSDSEVRALSFRDQRGPLYSGFPHYGTRRFVAAISGVGSDVHDGLSWTTPKLTLADALADCSSGDIIYFIGNVREEITTAAGLFGVTIVGAGTRPRHADAHTSNQGYFASTWKTPASPTAATPLCIVRQQGWRFVNILFDGPSDAAAVQLFRDGGAGDAERDASHAEFIGCKFVAGQNHIEFKGGLSQVSIRECDFFGATADSLLETVGAGIGTNNHFRIEGNHWHDNATHIDVALNYATIRGNTFGKASGDKIDLTGGSENMLHQNAFYGTYSIAGGYKAGTNDEWGGNWNSLSGGVTAADPA